MPTSDQKYSPEVRDKRERQRRGNEKKRVWEVSEGEALNSTSCGERNKTPERGLRSPRADGKNVGMGAAKRSLSLEDGSEEAKGAAETETRGTVQAKGQWQTAEG